MDLRHLIEKQSDSCKIISNNASLPIRGIVRAAALGEGAGTPVVSGTGEGNDPEGVGASEVERRTLISTFCPAWQ